MRYMNVGPEVPDEIQLCSSVLVSFLFNLVCLCYSFYLCMLSEKWCNGFIESDRAAATVTIV